MLVLGIGEVLLLLVVGGFAGPMLVAPTHRGGPLLLARRVEVAYDRWPAVLIVAAHGGLAAWLLTLINRAPWTDLEAGPMALGYHIGGVFRTRTGTIGLADVKEVKVKPWRPAYDIVAMIAVGLPMLAYAIDGRLTLTRFAEGVVLVALCGVLASVQSTNNLVIHIHGRKKPLLFAFSTLSLSGKDPAVTHAQLCEVAERINQLAIRAKALRSNGV